MQDIAKAATDPLSRQDMAEGKKPLKGILKPSRREPDSLIDEITHPSISRNDRARETAIKHATIIQQQRDHEALIFRSVATLSTYPLSTSADYTASQPSPSDAASFKSLVRLFQPTDLDDLVEERNSSGRCGYPLCPLQRKRLTPGARWTLSHGEIVSADEVQKWCSTDCARRAMWVRVQLSETAAWERAGIDTIEIELQDDQIDKLHRYQAGLRDVHAALRDAKPTKGAEGSDNEPPLVEAEVKENTVVNSPEAPALDRDAKQHQLIDGYKVAS